MINDKNKVNCSSYRFCEGWVTPFSIADLFAAKKANASLAVPKRFTNNKYAQITVPVLPFPPYKILITPLFTGHAIPYNGPQLHAFYPSTSHA